MSRTSRLALALLLALPAQVPAQESGRTYQVEIVVFEQSGPTAEVFTRPEPALPPLGPDAEPGTPGDASVPGTTAEPPVAAGLSAGFGGPAGDLRLRNIAAALDRRGYRVLWHQAWTQPASRLRQDGAVTLPVLAALGGGKASAQLDGSVELTAGRYLHLGLELETPAPGAGDYTLSQRRRVKINELNYFDHPRLGAIAVVTVPGSPAAPATR